MHRMMKRRIRNVLLSLLGTDKGFRARSEGVSLNGNIVDYIIRSAVHYLLPV